MDNQIDIQKFNNLKSTAKEEYYSIKKVRCPYLQDDVFFNDKGFNHLLFKSWNRARSLREQYTRLKLLNLIPLIISKSHTLQEYDERKLLIRQKINSRWEKRLKTVRYYVFIAIIEKIRIKVILKEIEGGEKFFYSLYPFWKTDPCDMKKKLLYSGNLEED